MRNFLEAANEVFSKNSLISLMGVTMGAIFISPLLKKQAQNYYQDSNYANSFYIATTLLSMRIGYGVGGIINSKNYLYKDSFYKYNIIFCNSVVATIASAPIAIVVSNDIMLPIYDKIVDCGEYLYNKFESIYDVFQ